MKKITIKLSKNNDFQDLIRTYKNFSEMSHLEMSNFKNVVRKKLSENTKKQFEDPEARRKQSERAKKQFEDPDIRKQMSEKKKKYYEDNKNPFRSQPPRKSQYQSNKSKK